MNCHTELVQTLLLEQDQREQQQQQQQQRAQETAASHGLGGIDNEAEPFLEGNPMNMVETGDPATKRIKA